MAVHPSEMTGRDVGAPAPGFWTGSVNDPYRLDARVGFYDTTLRDGEQTVGVVLDPEQKLEIARALDDLGVERIEAGFPRVSDEDRHAIELIRDAGLRAEIWGFSRAVQADVEALLELGLRASVVESPISDLKLVALGVSREEMLERIRRAVSFAAGRGVAVAYFGVDGTRADPEFFDAAYDVAVDAGAREAVVVDTLGVAAPEAVAEVVARTKERLGGPGPFHRHHDLGGPTAAPRAGEGARRARAAARDRRGVSGARFRRQTSVTQRVRKTNGSRRSRSRSEIPPLGPLSPPAGSPRQTTVTEGARG